jgi:hypothetical protein
MAKNDGIEIIEKVSSLLEEIKKENKNESDIENARVKYSSVIDLKNTEGQIQWSRYSAMLIANTIFIGFIGYKYSNGFCFPSIFNILFGLFPLLGLILCFSWYRMTRRGFMWTRFWMKKANELESEISGKVNPIIGGKELMEVTGGSGITEKASVLVIYIFVVIYFLLLVFNFGV